MYIAEGNSKVLPGQLAEGILEVSLKIFLMKSLDYSLEESMEIFL